jgi:hypothetical protein
MWVDSPAVSFQSRVLTQAKLYSKSHGVRTEWWSEYEGASKGGVLHSK